MPKQLLHGRQIAACLAEKGRAGVVAVVVNGPGLNT